ncbi:MULTISPECIES: hypothetical protein [Bradyrhizobium]|jgi:hypothetical protein|uniref:Uncharacterized protein n=1 Tax=Bradyrhizobium arachidis TaxID=858423 RepID=A0AAE7NPF4_9BRAD|nr:MULTISPECIES: hypothetical protein [Bradyrhizobium]QOG17703.1 hypothetical protein FOM02_10465 [Bradyrhizobium sp. SEMIA]QOZ69628.1 hypothetical protein WN72_27400 [Bradyrhizobium arachidis]UFW45723.1 hypothetical protein BaraCB756_25735 [Bradyrhizobium arachidis]SFU73619.1 hypothetical protein SAMN05192541_104149 [Bradyrhizobium arachidis]
MSLQIYVEINGDQDPKIAAKHEDEITALARASLGDVSGVAIDGMAVDSEANLDPVAVAHLAVLLTAMAGAVGAGAKLLAALRKMVTEGGALIRAIKVEIGGRPRSLESVTPEEIDKELRAPRRH